MAKKKKLKLSRKPKKILRDIDALLAEAETGEYSTKSRDFGRGVTFLTKEIRKLM